MIFFTDKNKELIESYFKNIHPELEILPMKEARHQFIKKKEFLKRNKEVVYIIYACKKNVLYDPNRYDQSTLHILKFNPMTKTILELRVFGKGEQYDEFNFVDDFYGIIPPNNWTL